MKKIFTLSLLALSLNLSANKIVSALYVEGIEVNHKCSIIENNMAVYDWDNENNCPSYEMPENNLCFKGLKKPIVEGINSDKFNWDEEWLENAYYYGPDKIIATYIDGPNDQEVEMLISRCND